MTASGSGSEAEGGATDLDGRVVGERCGGDAGASDKGHAKGTGLHARECQGFAVLGTGEGRAYAATALGESQPGFGTGRAEIRGVATRARARGFEKSILVVLWSRVWASRYESRSDQMLLRSVDLLLDCLIDVR